MMQWEAPSKALDLSRQVEMTVFLTVALILKLVHYATVNRTAYSSDQGCSCSFRYQAKAAQLSDLSHARTSPFGSVEEEYLYRTWHGGQKVGASPGIGGIIAGVNMNLWEFF